MKEKILWSSIITAIYITVSCIILEFAEAGWWIVVFIIGAVLVLFTGALIYPEEKTHKWS